MAELRLRMLADAGDLAAETAAKDAAGWLAQETRTPYADARADLRWPRRWTASGRCWLLPCVKGLRRSRRRA